MSGVRQIMGSLNFNVVGDLGFKVSAYAAIGYAASVLKSAGQQYAANVTGSLAAAAGWISGITAHAQSFKEWDQFITQQGNHSRSWRSGASGVSMLAAVTLGGIALKQSSVPGEEVDTVLCAAFSGICSNASGFFHQLEINAARQGALTKKVAEQRPEGQEYKPLNP